MKPQALVLDFGGVISRTLFETHALTEQVLDLPNGCLTWQGPFDPSNDTLWQSMQADEISERDYWMQRTQEVGQLAGQQWTSMQQFVIAARGADPMQVIRPEFIDTLQRAQAAGVRLAILSNELDLFYGAEFRTKLPFLAEFEVIVDATYTQVLKPDPRAYHQVLEQLNLKPEQCVFVDDQLRNINGALECGLKTVHFNVHSPADSYAAALQHFNL